MRGDGTVLDEYSTLVAPGVPLRNAEFHQITEAQITRAPTFADIAGDLIAYLSDAVMVAHNLSFEEGFLRAEFGALNIRAWGLPGLCTLHTLRSQLDRHGYKQSALYQLMTGSGCAVSTTPSPTPATWRGCSPSCSTSRPRPCPGRARDPRRPHRCPAADASHRAPSVCVAARRGGWPTSPRACRTRTPRLGRTRRAWRPTVPCSATPWRTGRSSVRRRTGSPNSPPRPGSHRPRSGRCTNRSWWRRGAGPRPTGWSPTPNFASWRGRLTTSAPGTPSRTSSTSPNRNGPVRRAR